MECVFTLKEAWHLPPAGTGARTGAEMCKSEEDSLGTLKRMVVFYDHECRGIKIH